MHKYRDYGCKTSVKVAAFEVLTCVYIIGNCSVVTADLTES